MGAAVQAVEQAGGFERIEFRLAGNPVVVAEQPVNARRRTVFQEFLERRAEPAADESELTFGVVVRQQVAAEHDSAGVLEHRFSQQALVRTLRTVEVGGVQQGHENKVMQNSKCKMQKTES